MAENIIVIVREVWDTRDLVGGVLDEAGNIKPGAMQTRFEPEDLNALEMALRAKDAQGAKVTAVSVGEPGPVDVLRECLYRGVDAVHRVEGDPKAMDDQAMAARLAGAIRTIGMPDLILVGTTILDGENGLLGAMLAAQMGLDEVSYVDALESLGGGKAVGKRAIEMGYESVEAACPAVFCVGVALLEDDPRAPRSAKAMLKLKLKKAPIPVVSATDAGAAAARTTEVLKMEAIPPRAIESRPVDPENEAELRAMLNDVLKGA
jgi:electron transfer flavoprotein beta subunit